MFEQKLNLFDIIVKISLILGLWVSIAWSAASPVGIWKTVDDETGHVKSLVEITESSGELKGKIVKLFRKPDEDQDPRCEKCEGDKKDKPILGLDILWGLKKDSDAKWSGGEIMDPKKGKIYSCKMEVIDDGKKLRVRGFLGFSLLGRTQTWERQEELVP
ncbi:MAG: DUF2147 domain-containing protein [Bdellovibrionaceae bacterium]|nr:DUF2147 domain-containing protein [Pseudobdellovibrionaceae bacterium]